MSKNIRVVQVPKFEYAGRIFDTREEAAGAEAIVKMVEYFKLHDLFVDQRADSAAGLIVEHWDKIKEIMEE